jgi:mRNA interferase HicA
VESSELHRKIRKNGWKFLRAEGTSHYIFEKNGRTYPVPFQGRKKLVRAFKEKFNDYPFKYRNIF